MKEKFELAQLPGQNCHGLGSLAATVSLPRAAERREEVGIVSVGGSLYRVSLSVGSSLCRGQSLRGQSL